ncbi:MAG: amidohydrolase family protein [Dehalococcoidia bacterium]|nr:amidohydrolase family protein [Dehalococcoidia bacterium]
MVDLLFANGTVIDGTGMAGYRGSVAVTGDTVQVMTGDVSAVDAGRVINASGYVICPGFIDMHSHSDLKLLTEPAHEAKIRQGVTTEALGMDGLSYAPTTPRGLEQLLVYLAAVNGEAPDVRWSSVADFLALFEGNSACNVLHFVPHAAIRVAAMGWSSRLPTDAELNAMRDLTRQGMRDGAFGFTTGGRTAIPTNWPPSPRWPPRRAVSTAPTLATPWATACWTHSARRWKSAGVPARRCISPTTTARWPAWASR